jgi:hypothetical protein
MTNMDLNRDELYRQLRDADREQVEATRSLREVLKRWFGGRSDGLSIDDKAAVLGVPSPARRTFFRAGGATLLGAAFVAACGDDDDAAETGSPPTTAASTATTAAPATTGQPDGEQNMDLVLARTAASVELLAVAAYQTAIDSGLVTTQAVADAAVLFQSHHEEHAGVLNAAVRDVGGDVVTEPNAFLLDNLVATADLSSELAIVQFARGLEDAAASTYVFAAGVLSAPALRQAIMSIGGVEAKHVTALDLALQALGEGSGPAFDDGAFYAGERRVPDEALLS